MNFNVAVIPGDGIGPEIVAEARRVLDVVGNKFGHSFNYTEVDMGGISIDKHAFHLLMRHLKQQSQMMLCY